MRKQQTVQPSGTAMGVRKRTDPRPLQLSKRANVFYLEHARVLQQDDRIVYLTQDGGEFEQLFNVPERNTAFLLLGKGTSITDAAMRRLAASNVVVGFCGSGGSPLYGICDLAFLAPQSEYRPTKYMQRWAQMWLDPALRLETARCFLRKRVQTAVKCWKNAIWLQKRGIALPDSVAQRFISDMEQADTAQELLLAEARWAKQLYATLSSGYGFPFTREEGARRKTSRADICNGLLDHGNYIAYGYAAVTLCGLGISFAMPVLHGKTRRGALVFDLADVIKDAYVMPLAFECAQDGDSQKDFRERLIELCQEEEVLDFLFDFMKEVCN